jgi:hypothetical protein
MANDLRYRQNNLGGTLTQALNAGGTLINSANLAAMGLINSNNQAAITLYNSATGEYEIVRVISHAVNATTATILATAESGARPASGWPSGSTWRHGPTVEDWSHAQHVATDSTKPALLLKGISNTASLMELYAPNGALRAFFRGDAGLGVRDSQNAFARDSYSPKVGVTIGNAKDATVVPLSIRYDSATQSADAFRLEKQDSTLLLSVNKDGQIVGPNGNVQTDQSGFPVIASGNPYADSPARVGSFLRTSLVNGMFSAYMRFITAAATVNANSGAQRVFLGGNTSMFPAPHPVLRENNNSQVGTTLGTIKARGRNPMSLIYADGAFFIGDMSGGIMSFNVLQNELWEFELLYPV